MSDPKLGLVANQGNGLYEMLDSTIDDFGYELVHLEFTGGDKSRVLRLYIDAPGGITLDDCSFVSQQIGRLLDVEDPIEGRYSLEVSSPGIERPLAKREHFESALGQRIEVQTIVKIEGRKKFLGTLAKCAQTTVTIAVDGCEFEIELNNIRKARLKPDLQKMI